VAVRLIVENKMLIFLVMGGVGIVFLLLGNIMSYVGDDGYVVEYPKLLITGSILIFCGSIGVCAGFIIKIIKIMKGL
jgi:hypothetical protein